MEIGIEAHVRYYQIVFLEYYLESNVFKCAQAGTNGMAAMYTEFYIPAAIVGVDPLFEWVELDSLKYNKELNMWADMWISDIGFSVIKSPEFDQTGDYYCFPIKNCLKNSSITDAVDYSKQPRVITAEKRYVGEQPGDALIGETITGKNIKGKVIMLYGISKGMKPKMYRKFTPEILTNKFSEFHVVLEVDDCYWVSLPIGAIGIKSNR